MIKILAASLTIAALASCNESASTPRADPAAATGDRAISILNAGVRAELGTAKILFDPVYDNHFGNLQELGPDLIDNIVTGKPPYDNVDAVFVSHAHGDHFSVSKTLQMLAAQPPLLLVAPAQAIGQLKADSAWDDAYGARITAITLENGEEARSFTLFGATIEAMRTPHSGWPNRHTDTHNITYRITGPSGARVMHLGDAAPSAEHFAPYEPLLTSARTHMAFVPFWTFSVQDADGFIDGTLNADHAVGMHVPAATPPALASSGRDYFSGEGQVRPIDASE